MAIMRAGWRGKCNQIQLIKAEAEDQINWKLY